MTIFRVIRSVPGAGTAAFNKLTLFERIKALLGEPRLTDDRAIAGLVEKRLDTGILARLKDAGLTDDEIYLLIAPRRTLTHRRARREPLSKDESDKAVRVARLVALGEQVFGESARAWRWLRKPKRQLEGRSPLQVMTTEAGARLVEEWLYRIDDGMAA